VSREEAFVRSLDARIEEILARCSSCGRCVEVCPTAGPAAIDRSEPRAIVNDVLAILRGNGDPASRGARWAEACTGSGACLTACGDGVNPRFMLAMTRVRLSQRKSDEERRLGAQKAFGTMSRGVKVLSRLQLPTGFLDRVTRSALGSASAERADVVMYLGCNVLKNPAHRAALPRRAGSNRRHIQGVRRTRELLRHPSASLR
jgi:heterodisulfide reductase subunit D